MPHFWDYFARSPSKQRNLQDGLFQIASQTCNLLVQVNNTNNISYGNGTTNIHLNDISIPTRPEAPILQSETDREQLLVLIPSARKTSKFKPGNLGKRLSVMIGVDMMGWTNEGNYDGGLGLGTKHNHKWYNDFTMRKGDSLWSCVPRSEMFTFQKLKTCVSQRNSVISSGTSVNSDGIFYLWMTIDHDNHRRSNFELVDISSKQINYLFTKHDVETCHHYDTTT
jgi:hypothetical protein